MRRSALAMLVTGLSSASARAGCEPNGLYVFPVAGSIIPTNARLMLEGAGSEVDRFDKLGGELTMRSGNDEVVAVRVERLWVSTMKRVAYRLTPVAELKPNRTYVLAIDKVLPGYKILSPNSSPTLTWTTAGAADRTAPKYQNRPVVTEGQYLKSGDGFAKYLKIRTTLIEDGTAYFVVTLKRARGSTSKQVYPVPILGGEALVGHDGCSGGFTFDDGRAYKISLEAFDSAGNRAAEKLPEIEANAPLPGE